MECLHCKNGFTFRDGQILFSAQGNKKNENHFELNMVEEIIREVCTMYLRRVRLYEPIVSYESAALSGYNSCIVADMILCSINCR